MLILWVKNKQIENAYLTIAVKSALLLPLLHHGKRKTEARQIPLGDTAI